MGNKKTERKAVVMEEIRELARVADSSVPGSAEANRSARKIWRRALKYKIKLGLMGRRICRNCHAWLSWGRNARIRFRPGKVVITCMACKNIRRIGHK